MIKAFPAKLFVPTVIFILFCGIFSYSHLVGVDIMEARNFVTAREIIENHNWLVPTMNGEFRFAKPPLPTWLTAVAMKFVGSDTNLAANRLPAGLAALLLLLFLYKFALAYGCSQKISLSAILILATSYMFMYLSRRGHWDIFCATFTMGAIYTLFAATTFSGSQPRYFIAAGIFTGLSIMSKGPVMLYTMLLPFLLSEIIFGDAKKYVQHWKMLCVSGLIALAIGAAWPAYLYLSFPKEFDWIALKEVDAWSNRHIKPFFWYLQFPVMSGLWMFLALPALCPSHSSKVIGERFPTRKIIFWIISSVVLLSLIPEKKDRYLLPVTVPLALLISGYASGLIDSAREIGRSLVTKWLLQFYTVLSVIFSVTGIFAGFYYFARYGFNLYVTIVMLASALLLVRFINMLVNQNTPVLLYYILAFALFTQSAASLIGQRIKPDNYMEIMRLRDSARLSTFTFYSNPVDMKVVWALNKKVKQWNSSILADLKASQTVVLMVNRKDSAVVSRMFSGDYLVVPENEYKFEYWQLYLVSKKTDQQQSISYHRNRLK